MSAPQEISIDVNDLTVGEIEEIEDLLDASFDSFAKEGARRGKFMRAIAWVSIKRTNPDFTYEDAGNIKISDITGEERPTSADEPIS
jgi:hypothetical protein